MIQLFVVFHKELFDECYKNIPQDILLKYFTFVAVNEKLQKKFTENKYKVIKEWELPIYDKTFQERGYNENSVIYHIYANNLHKEYKWIGFFQYDMVFNDNIIHLLLKNIEQYPKIYFATGVYPFTHITYTSWGELDTAEFIIKDYEAYFSKRFKTNLLYPMFNSYVITTEMYNEIMKWVVQLYPKIYPSKVQKPNKSNGYVGEIYERIMAYAVAQYELPCKLLNIFHNQGEYKPKCY